MDTALLLPILRTWMVDINNYIHALKFCTMSSILGSQPLPSTNKRPAAMEPSPKAKSESLESVRSKLRESLAAALALVSLQQNKALSLQQNKALSVGKNVQNNIAESQVPVDSQVAKSTSSVVDANSCHVQEKPSEALGPDVCGVSENREDGHSSLQGNYLDENKFHATDDRNFGDQENMSNLISSAGEVSFINSLIIKDELLQGHGLCWASELVDHPDERDYRDLKKPKLMDIDMAKEENGEASPCPLSLAHKIESELFKLFGGVNKKYKEKGRSLLFNLKDRSNPELRERVMSGEIPPERLCCMSAEELASKELSQWRMAKAEELGKMVVLQDSDVDIRRLVKKTHKGEFQVEVEHDDSVSVEVAVGTSSFAHIPIRSNDPEGQTPSKPKKAGSQTSPKARETVASKGDLAASKVDSVDPSHANKAISIPHDGTDDMQGIVVDELKDAEFLPPIVSLDEFMESLDSDPPFENLEKGGGQDASAVAKSTDGTVSLVDSYAADSEEPSDTALDEPTKVVVNRRADGSLKVSGNDAESEKNHAIGELKGESIWEGLVQLTISAMAMVTGFFKSGERAPTKDWGSFLEIKGRVRLDAFEKFVQELRMSRSRAIMVVQFCWKEGSPEDGRLHLLEVADSYVVDERVGFAEPAPGVELYFCPPHPKILELLCKHLPKEQVESLDSVDNGLIGIVVWRKAVVTAISPKMSSYQRQNSKKQHSSKKQHLKDAHVNAKQPSLPLPDRPPANHNTPSDDDNDDIPPGFGPGASGGRDEDDLPEFDFSNSTKQKPLQFPVPNRPMGTRPHVQASPPTAQMRELVHKYGQGNVGANHVNWQQPGQVSGIETEPWNDDDDDIPEWQPHQGTRSQPTQIPPSLHSFQSPARPANLINQQSMTVPMQHLPAHQPVVPLATPLPVHMQPVPTQMAQMPSQQTWRPGPPWPPAFGSSNPLMQPCHYGSQPVQGQFQRTQSFGVGQNGMDRRPDIPRSRGA